MKRYIANDFHNGNKAGDYDKVMSFLDLVDDDADEFLIPGDFEELLWLNFGIVSTIKPYSDITDKVKAIASRKPVKYIIGNHDWNVGLYASQMKPIEIITPFAENGVYYCHGHEFDWLSVIIGTPIDPIWWENAMPFVFPTQFLLWVIAKLWTNPEDTYHWGVSIVHEGARSFAVNHGYHSMVLGHTHFPVVEDRGGINIYNSGDMLDSYSYLVQEDGIIKLEYF